MPHSSVDFPRHFVEFRRLPQQNDQIKRFMVIAAKQGKKKQCAESVIVCHFSTKLQFTTWLTRNQTDRRCKEALIVRVDVS
jgi:hypothetical protein